MDGICHVCGQPLDDLYTVRCIACGNRVHFQSTENSGVDCARIVTQLTVCGLAFICNPCFEKASPKSNKD